MAKMFLNRALAEAVRLEMERDDRVLLMGEDIINRGGGMSTFLGIPQDYPDRCFDMPIAESGYSHFAVGAALQGYRPIVDLMFSDFSAIAFDAIVNNASKWRFNSQGKVSVPIVFFAGNGGRGTYGSVGSGVNHSQCVEPWFMNVPGIKIVAPYYAEDALGLLRASIRDDDPVVFLYHEGSLGKKSEVGEDVYIPLNNAAKVCREGADITVVAIQSMVPVVEQAAAELEAEGIDIEIIDPRVLMPLDMNAIKKSIAKTGRLLIVQEAPSRGGFASEIAARAADEAFELLKTPIKKIGALNSPIGSGFSEGFMMPHVEDVIAKVKEMLGK
ncbi:MAG: transketolase C-terminal domain-containing protein [Eubacterium sp.]